MQSSNRASARRLSVLADHLASASSSSSFARIRSAPTSSSSPSRLLLEGQVAIITGSGQGIGAEAAVLFAQHGAKVVVTDLDAQKAEAVVQKIKAAGGEAISVPGDVTDPAYPDHLMKTTIEKFGALDILVNNAGYTWDGVIHRMTDKQWDAMLLVHNTAPFRLIRAAAPYMRDVAKQEIEKNGAAKPRCIINISSTSGLHGNAGQINYATAKMGILGLTKTVAKEWGPFNIRCNAVAFGFIATRLTGDKAKDNFIEVDGKKVSLGIPGTLRSRESVADSNPLRRIGSPADGAGAILLLALPYADYITGHCLEATGGAGI